MNELEFCGKYTHENTKESVHVFRQLGTGEILILEKEWKKICEYRNTKALFRDNMAVNTIHYIILRQQRLRDFKVYLKNTQLFSCSHVSQLTFITETGLSFLLGKSCNAKAQKLGHWLLSEVFPQLHQYPNSLYFKIIESNYLHSTLVIILYNGRPGILASGLASLLQVDNIEEIFFESYGYVPELHLVPCDSPLYQLLMQNIPQLSSEYMQHDFYLFYESGIYRLLQQKKTDKAMALKMALEKEILPIVHRPDVQWQSLPLASLQTENSVAENALPWNSSIAWGLSCSNLNVSFNNITINQIANKMTSLENTIQRLERTLTDPQNVLNEIQTLKINLSTNTNLLLKQKETTDKISQIIQKNFSIFDENEESISQETFIDEDKQILLDEKIPYPSLMILKDIARSLGLYYIDQHTLQLRFVRMLIKQANSIETYELRQHLDKLGIKYGSNRFIFGTECFYVWRKKQ